MVVVVVMVLSIVDCCCCTLFLLELNRLVWLVFVSFHKDYHKHLAGDLRLHRMGLNGDLKLVGLTWFICLELNNLLIIY